MYVDESTLNQCQLVPGQKNVYVAEK